MAAFGRESRNSVSAPRPRLKLDFMYIAPSKAQAQALEQVLARETDYNVTAEPGEGGGWIVEGSTQPSAVTLEILE